MPPLSARLSPALQVVTAAVQKAGRRLLRDFGEVEQLQVSVKGPSDFVSTADLRAEQTLKEELSKARPGFAFLMEESGASGGDDWEWRWVVDPLDGTTNFLHGIPHWAISVGVEKRIAPDKTELVAGVIYNPASDEMFWAEKGVGAFLNGARDLLHALIAGGQRNDPAGRANAVGNGNGRAHEGEDESVLLEHGGVRGYVSESGDARTAEHPAYSLMRRD